MYEQQILADWDKDSKANLNIVLILRALIVECYEWIEDCAAPQEIHENIDAALRSDWQYLQKRYPEPLAIIERYFEGQS